MKILLLSDVSMNPNAGGINQTLYNLLLFTDPADLLCVSFDKEIQRVPPSAPFTARYLTYKFEILPVVHNRLRDYLSPFIHWFNFSVNYNLRRFKKLRGDIKAFAPDLVISCPNSAVGVLMHHKLLSGINVSKVFPYFMDDWMYGNTFKWFGNNTQQMVKELLSKNRSWLMISQELADILSKRYEIEPQQLLPVHNPVDLSNAPNVNLSKTGDAYTLAYAGALWPMHFDSFTVIAEAVFELKKKMDISLVLYTRKTFWDYRKETLEPLEVIYGGDIPYTEIHQKLALADALILSSSFLEQYSSHSKGSIQTKITDYLKSKRLIISCGPGYSANHNFLKRNKCGVCIETNDVNIAEDQLYNVLTNINEYQSFVENGWNLLKNDYTFPVVHKKLKEFLSAT